MNQRPRASLFLPLLAGFRQGLRRPREATPPSARDAAIHAATATWLTPDTLDDAPDGELADHLGGFYRAVVPGHWHPDCFRAHASLARFALVHVLFGADPLGERLSRCSTPGGPYHVPGAGPAFWFALGKALGPGVVPDWRPGVRRGVARLGLIAPAVERNTPAGFTHVARLYAQLMREFPDLDADLLDTFFARAANPRGRDLGPVTDPTEPTPDRLAHGVRTLRASTPTRPRVQAHADAAAARLALLDAAVGLGEPAAILSAAGVDATPGDWVFDVVRRAALARGPADALGLTRPAEAELFAALLNARAPLLHPEWDDRTRRGVLALSDAVTPESPAGEQYRLGCEVMAAVRERLRVHPAEVPDLFALYAELFSPPDPAPPPGVPGAFGGFCQDTFAFLAELAEHNATEWMARERERYNFAVRTPVVELCSALAARYVSPVLRGEYGWDLDTDAKPGKAISSINRNDFGRAAPYAADVWVAFYRASSGPRRADVQFAVRVDQSGVAFGVRLGGHARDAGRRVRLAVQAHGELLFESLKATGAASACQFGAAPGDGAPLADAAGLRQWATGKELFAGRTLAASDPVLTQDELVGEILLTFDKLVPLFAAAVDADPVPVLARRAGHPAAGPGFDAAAFRAATYLGEAWLARTLDLLRLKKQLVFQGVPGTGKTHVARTLARLLTGGRPDLVRLVQFHPGYSYEEFVEGIRPQARAEGTTGDGVSYAVEPGVLAAFVARARAAPADPHVLVIDELNRGNLPRVFGELLFLLEYRDQEVTLPYSKQPFRLPENLTLLATMNPADQSVATLDQALRRRFSFVDVQPDPAVLARYFADFPPAEPDPTFGPRLVRWFDDLNRKLARDGGPDRQVGHSFLMVPGLTVDKLAAIWDHQVRPLLDAAYPGRADRLDALAFGGRTSKAPAADGE